MKNDRVIREVRARRAHWTYKDNLKKKLVGVTLVKVRGTPSWPAIFLENLWPYTQLSCPVQALRDPPLLRVRLQLCLGLLSLPSFLFASSLDLV